jgi:hypothetical protein
MENFARRPKNGNKIIHNRFGASTIRGWSTESAELTLTDETECNSSIDSEVRMDHKLAVIYTRHM